MEAPQPTKGKSEAGSQLIQRPSHVPFADWFYETEWQPKPRTAVKKNSGSTGSHWIIFADQIGVADSLVAQLANRNELYTLVQKSTEFRKFPSGNFILRPDTREDYERLFSELEERGVGVTRSIAFLWGLDSLLKDEKLDAVAMHDTLFQNCIPVVNLMQVLAGTKTSLRTKLWIGTSGAQSLALKKDGFALTQTPAVGLGKVYALEYPDKWGGLIDIDLDAANGFKEAAAHLYQEISLSDGEDEIAFRGDQRFVARLVHSECPTSQAPRFRSDRTYLITGGLGEIGLETAKWMIEQGARSLVLLGRNVPARSADASEPGDQRLEAVRRLEAIGAKVHTVSADVANYEQMKALLARIDAEMPSLGGIFHLAIDSVNFAQLDDIRSEHVYAMMRAKAVGAWVLHLLTEQMNLDYFVLFSSMVSVWGSWGLAHYAAANRCVDLLSHYRRSLGLPALTVNWGSWDTARLESSGQRQMFQKFGTPPMRPADALSALGLVMTSGKAQAGVVDVDWDLLRSGHEARRPLPLFQQIGSSSVSEAQDKPQLSEVPSDGFDLPEITTRLRPRFTDLVERNGLGRYRELAPEIDLLCGGYIVAAFQRMGCSFAPGQQWNTSGLAARLRVIPEHFRVFDRMIEILVEDGVLIRKADKVEVQADRLPVDPDCARQELMQNFPDYANELEMLERCASKLDLSLRGECNVLHLLFPDGSLAAAEHMYQKSPANRTYNLLLTEALVAVSRGLKGSPLRVLEIGAGTGGSTAYILPALSGVRVEYVFSDVAQLFLSNARKKFADYPWVSFRMLNLEKEPSAQGFNEKDFDIIIAANVVHATSDLRRSLGRIRSLLAPGGVFLLLELTTPSRGIDLTFGLTEGWWKYSDVDLRPSYPLMHRGVWKRLLNEVGFANVGIVPEETDANVATQQTVILGREPVASEQTSARRAAPSVSRVVKTQESIPTDWLENIGQLSMEERRAALNSQIRREVAAVLNLDADDIIREDQSFSSLGLDSLTALELKSRLQNHLHCSLPPTVAFEYPTIRAMSGFLESVLEASGNLKQEVTSSGQREELDW